MNAAHLLIAACGLVACSHLAAQSTLPPGDAGPPQTFVHESWTVQDGLPVNSITGVLQSRDGYLWIATFDGLARFDGVRFTVYNSANSDGLPSNRIVNLREARDGSLWFRTEQGQLVRFRDGTFTHIGPNHGLTASVLTFSEDSSGTIWVGSPTSRAR